VREIGGYLGFEQLIKNEYYKELVALNTARNALLYLIKAKKIKKIYVPCYICDSVTDMLMRYDHEFEYYHINDKFEPLFEKELQDDEYLYLVNFYGQVTNEKINSLKQIYGKIILDNVQSYFQKPIQGIDTIYSCRKYFGVPDGAYLSTDSLFSEKLEIDLSKERMSHLLGRFEGTASDYYSDFQDNDKSLENLPLMQMSKLTKNILGAIDYEEVRRTRDANYAYLESELKRINSLQLISQSGAFAYPFYNANGIEIRKKLSALNIYIPTLWPNVLEENLKDSIEYDYAANILPLPCDQRYSVEDMKTIIKSILAILG